MRSVGLIFSCSFLWFGLWSQLVDQGVLHNLDVLVVGMKPRFICFLGVGQTHDLTQIARTFIRGKRQIDEATGRIVLKAR